LFTSLQAESPFLGSFAENKSFLASVGSQVIAESVILCPLTDTLVSGSTKEATSTTTRKLSLEW
jgi:hypothetical protein